MKPAEHDKVLRPKGERKPFRRWIRPLPMAIAACMIGFAVWFVFGEKGLWERHKLAQRFENQAGQIAQLEAEKAVLTEYYGELKTGEDHALERAAREQNLVAPGETIYDIKVVPAADAK